MKRVRGPDAVGDLQQHSKQLRMMGQDPLPATLHQAQLAGLHQGPFSQASILHEQCNMSVLCEHICHSCLACLPCQASRYAVEAIPFWRPALCAVNASLICLFEP